MKRKPRALILEQALEEIGTYTTSGLIRSIVEKALTEYRRKSLISSYQGVSEK